MPIPEFKENGKYEEDRLPAKDTTITLKTSNQPTTVLLLASKKKLDFKYADGELKIELPASLRTNLVDVIRVELRK